MTKFYLLIFFLVLVFTSSAQITYKWTRPNGSAGSWADPLNWTPNRSTPATNDILEFDGNTNAIVNFFPATETIGKLRIYNNAIVTFGVGINSTINIGNGGILAPHFSIETGSTLDCNTTTAALTMNILPAATGTVSGTIFFTGNAHRLTAADPNGLQFLNGAVFNPSSGFTGNPFGSTTANSVVFQSGSSFIQQAGANPFSLAAPASVVIFQKGSLYSFRQNTLPSFSGRTVGNFEINLGGFNQTISSGNAPFRCDTFTLRNGIALNFDMPGGIIVSGDLVNLAGSLNFTPASKITILFDGNVSQQVRASGSLTFNGNVNLVVSKTASINLQANLYNQDSMIVLGKLYTNGSQVGGNSFQLYPENLIPAGVLTGNLTVNSNIISNVNSPANFFPGTLITGPGIPADTYVMKVAGTTVHMSRFATSTASGVTISQFAFKGTLGIGSTEGIRATGANGNVTSSVRNFIPYADYEYTGSFIQNTGTGLPSSVKNLILNKTALQNVTLTSPLTVEDTLKLQTGYLVTTGLLNLSLTDTTAISSANNIYGFANQGRQESFVRGPIKLNTNSIGVKTAPIGKDAYYAPVLLEKITPGNVTYTLEYFDQPYADIFTDTLPLDHVSKQEHWLISSDVANSTDDAKVTLSWRPYSKVGDGIAANDSAALADLVVAHYIDDGAGLKWRVDNADVGIMPKSLGSDVNNGMLTTNFATGLFSPFTLGTKSIYNILPLKIISFLAVAQLDVSKLSWSVENEENTKIYYIERSADGINFTAINSEIARQLPSATYYWNDLVPLTGWNYYRLKVIDIRNRISYSKIQKTWIGSNVHVSIFPNPVKHELLVSVPATSSISTLEIVNSSGQVLKSFQTPESPVTINVVNLAKGIYYLRVHISSQIITRKFIKE